VKKALAGVARIDGPYNPGMVPSEEDPDLDADGMCSCAVGSEHKPLVTTASLAFRVVIESDGESVVEARCLGQADWGYTLGP